MPEIITDRGEEATIATPQEVHRMLESTDAKSRDYLKRHLEDTTSHPASSTEYVASQKPLVDNIEYPEEGTIEARKGNLSLNLTYEMLTADSPQRLLDAAFDQDRDISDSSVSNWRIVDQFSLADNSCGKKLELMDVVPPEIRVILRTTPPSGYSFKPEINVCVFAENSTKPGAILLLLHEIGHSWAIRKLDPEARENFLQSKRDLEDGILISNEAWAQILEQERDAWAFAIKAIWPFLADEDSGGWLTRAEVRKIVNDQALQTYSNVFRNELTRDPRFEELTADLDKDILEETKA
jgi:hypothetical protein